MAKRLYYRIKEVADRVGEEASTIRYWEAVFPHIAPNTTPNGTRQYTEKDIQRIMAVQHLLREKKMTIDGARAELKSHRDKVELRSNTLTRLRSIYSQLLDLRRSLDEPIGMQ